MGNRRARRIGRSRPSECSSLHTLFSSFVIDEASRFKQNILFYLLSHVTCLKFKPTAQIILLEAVEDICDKVKAQLLLPVLEELVNYMERQELNKVYGAVAFERFEALVLGAFDKTIGGDVNKASGATMWATFLAAVGLHYGQGTFGRFQFHSTK